MAEKLAQLESRNFRIIGYRLGLKGASTTAYCLGKRFPNLKEMGEAEAALAPTAPPAALVIEADRGAEPAGALPQRGGAKLDVPVKKGAFRILLNRTVPDS